MGMGLDGRARRLLAGEQQHRLPLENRKCFRDIHSASQHLPGGRGRAVPRRRDRGKQLAPSTGSPPRGARTGQPGSPVLAGLERSPSPATRPRCVLLGVQGRGGVLWREEAPALGFGYCSRSEGTVSVAGAHRGGGSLAGGT